MAQEVALDLIHTPVLQGCFDQNSFCLIGPGAQRGLNRLHGRPVDFGGQTPYDEFRYLQECTDLCNYMLRTEPAFCNNLPLHLHDVQFQLCEFDKHEFIAQADFHNRPKYGLPADIRLEDVAHVATRRLLERVRVTMQTQAALAVVAAESESAPVPEAAAAAAVAEAAAASEPAPVPEAAAVAAPVAEEAAATTSAENNGYYMPDGNFIFFKKRRR